MKRYNHNTEEAVTVSVKVCTLITLMYKNIREVFLKSLLWGRGKEGRKVVGGNPENSQMGMIRRKEKKKNLSVALRAESLSNV